MKNQIIPFEYGENQVRSLLINDEPWFVAKDVCDVLEIQNATQAVDRLDEDERAMFNIGRQGETNIISESGLYSLTLGSKKSEAKPFKRWITHDVIPEIRKTGSYTVQPMSQAEIIAAQANLLVEIEHKTNAALSAAESAQNRLTGALDALAKPPETDWQQSIGDRIKRICLENSLSYVVMFGDLYKELEDTTHVDLKKRVIMLRKRMEKSGATYKERMAITKLHIISINPALKLAFDGIVRRMNAKYASARLPQ